MHRNSYSIGGRRSKKHHKKRRTHRHRGGAFPSSRLNIWGDIKSVGDMLIPSKDCGGIPNGGLSCGLARGGSRKSRRGGNRRRRTYKGGNFSCPYPVPSRVANVLGPWACNISRGGSEKAKKHIRHKKDYYKCGPFPWPFNSKCPPSMKCHKAPGHPAGIGHGRGSHTCY